MNCLTLETPSATMNTLLEVLISNNISRNGDSRLFCNLMCLNNSVNFLLMTYTSRAKEAHFTEVLPMLEMCTMIEREEIWDFASRAGYLEMVKFLHFKRKEGCVSRTMNCAVDNGHLEIVKFLHYNRTEGCTRRAMNLAAENGHLEVVKFFI